MEYEFMLQKLHRYLQVLFVVCIIEIKYSAQVCGARHFPSSKYYVFMVELYSSGGMSNRGM